MMRQKDGKTDKHRERNRYCITKSKINRCAKGGKKKERFV